MNVLPSAVFLDRDGTIIEDGHYISRPDQVRLIHGAAEAVARMNAALVPVIVVTNQSGIGRGFFSMSDYEAVRNRVGDELASFGAHIDWTYHCAHAPDDRCDCRKPGTLLFEQAARDHAGIELERSLYIGDRWRDLAPGLVFGGNGVLIPGTETPPEDILLATERARVAPTLSVATDWYFCSN